MGSNNSQTPNPFTKARQDARLSLNDFASVIGLGTSTLILLDKAAISNPKIPLAKLAALGYDAQAARDQYAAFRKAVSAERLAQLQEARKGA